MEPGGHTPRAGPPLAELARQPGYPVQWFRGWLANPHLGTPIRSFSRSEIDSLAAYYESLAAPGPALGPGREAFEFDPSGVGAGEPGRAEPDAPSPGGVDPGDLDPGGLEPGDLDPGDFEPGDLEPGDVGPGEFGSGEFGPGEFSGESAGDDFGDFDLEARPGGAAEAPGQRPVWPPPGPHGR